MVHGDCSSSGCYAMTDEQIQEIFALGRESFRGGQRSFQVQAYPFRMTADNMVRHRSNPNMPFWQMIKEGSDTFELTKAPPKVDVCNKRYVFNATPTDPSQRFEPSAACPPYSVPDDLKGALASRRADDNKRMASAGNFTPIAPVKTGKDGGMHDVFIAKIENPQMKAPGSLPAVVKLPGSTEGTATNEPAPAESIALAKADTVLAPAATSNARGTTAGTPSATTSVALANVPVPAPRPTDAPGTPRTQIAATSETSLFGARTPAAAGTQVASLDGGGFFSGVTKFFSRDETPAPATNVQAPPPAFPATSGFSLGNLFGGSSAPAPAPTAAAPVNVPVPPVRPSLPASSTSAARPASPSVAQPPAAKMTALPATAAPAPVAPRAAVVPAPTPYSAVPTPARAAAPVAATVPKPSQVTAAPQLRPSVASSAPTGGVSQEALYGTPGALPGAPILGTGTFNSSVQ